MDQPNQNQPSFNGLPVILKNKKILIVFIFIAIIAIFQFVTYLSGFGNSGQISNYNAASMVKPAQIEVNDIGAVDAKKENNLVPLANKGDIKDLEEWPWKLNSTYRLIPRGSKVRIIAPPQYIKDVNFNSSKSYHAVEVKTISSPDKSGWILVDWFYEDDESKINKKQ